MSGAAGLVGPIFSSVDGMVTMSTWVLTLGFVLVALSISLAVMRAGLPAALTIAAVLFTSAGGTCIWLDHQRVTERRALEVRLADLQARTQAPGSILSCLDANAGEAVIAGCETSLFGSPENLAAATSYTSALFTFMADAQRIVTHPKSQFAREFDRTRRTFEQDRFSLLANHLTVQEGCNAERCDLLVLLRDPTKVQANLEQRIFDTHVARYAAAWGPQIARASAPAPAPTSSPAGFTIGSTPIPAPTGKPLPPDYVLPSAESIPAISIMSNEPARETPRASAPSDANETPAPRRPQRAAQARSRDGADNVTPTVGAPLALTR